MEQRDFIELTCKQCAEGAGLGVDLSFAFQPVVDVRTRAVFSYEALVRGLQSQPSGHIFSQISDSNRYRFDQACRVKVVKMAAQLAVPVNVNINFYPNAVY